MGKRSTFRRRAYDKYDTPEKAVLPLLPHLKEGTMFVEPCAGKGHLVDHLCNYGHICSGLFDIKPGKSIHFILKADARSYQLHDDVPADCFITNPPWTRPMLHSIIFNLAAQRPTWLLFDADWLFTRQSATLLPYLRKIVAVGRVKWIPGAVDHGKDNAAWYLFDKETSPNPEFFGFSK